MTPHLDSARLFALSVRLRDGSTEQLDLAKEPFPYLFNLRVKYPQAYGPLLPFLTEATNNWVLPTLSGGYIPKGQVVLMWETPQGQGGRENRIAVN